MHLSEIQAHKSIGVLARQPRHRIGMAPLPFASFPGALAVSLLAASLGGVKVGFDLGVLNPCLSHVREDLSLGSWQEGFVVVLLIFSAAFGALGAGKAADSVGMIKAQLLTAACGAVGTAISAAACGPAALWTMSLGRLVAGLGMLPGNTSCPVRSHSIRLMNLRVPVDVAYLGKVV